ncbi:MAG: hypothetical protein LBT20_02225, partial [Clostridiales bacterium]|nr:hypothetical protein [Clostridiales bacterium]
MGLIYLIKSKSTEHIFKVGIAQTEQHCAVRFFSHSRNGYCGLIFDTTDKNKCMVFECDAKNKQDGVEYKAVEKELQKEYAKYRVLNSELYINTADKEIEEMLFDIIVKKLKDIPLVPIDIAAINNWEFEKIPKKIKVEVVEEEDEIAKELKSEDSSG